MEDMPVAFKSWLKKRAKEDMIKEMMVALEWTLSQAGK
jgi:hypothetical protein